MQDEARPIRDDPRYQGVIDRWEAFWSLEDVGRPADPHGWGSAARPASGRTSLGEFVAQMQELLTSVG